MKRLMIALLAIVALCSCNKGVNYNITGTVAQDEVGELYLVSGYGDESTIATTKINPEDGTFAFEGTVDEPMLAMVTDDNETPLTMLFIEPGKIAVVYDEVTKSYNATGTPANDNLNVVNDKLKDVQNRFYALMQSENSDKEQQQALIDEYNTIISTAVTENIDNILGAYLFRVESAELSTADLRARLEQFPASLRKTKMLKAVEEKLIAQEQTEIGAPYIEIVAKDTNDNEVAFSSLVGEGKWVLIDFWATWCGPCRGEIPYLVEAYKKYADKGFEIYGVSLDNNVEAWKSYVAENDMTWVNVIGVNADKKSPSADAYGVSSIPSNFLISPEGKIVAKNLRGEGVAAKLAEVLGE